MTFLYLNKKKLCCQIKNIFLSVSKIHIYKKIISVLWKMTEFSPNSLIFQHLEDLKFHQVLMVVHQILYGLISIILIKNSASKNNLISTMQAIVSEIFVMFNLKQVSIRDFFISMMKKVSQWKQIQNAKSEWAMEKKPNRNV